jgi:hypothetical protein
MQEENVPQYSLRPYIYARQYSQCVHNMGISSLELHHYYLKADLLLDGQ